MMPRDNDRLWAQVREAAAKHGWGNRSRVLQEAVASCLKAKLWPEGQHALRAHLERLWDQNAEVTGAN